MPLPINDFRSYNSSFLNAILAKVLRRAQHVRKEIRLKSSQYALKNLHVSQPNFRRCENLKIYALANVLCIVIKLALQEAREFFQKPQAYCAKNAV